MSYPRNAATPKAVTVGALVKVADGSLLASTAGVAVRVDLDGGGWGAGGGTIAVDATSSVFTYAPAQAETNGDVLKVALYIAGYVSVAANVIMDPLDLAVNATKLGGTSQTGRDIGASVLLSPGTGTGQLTIASGVVAASGNWNTVVPDAAGVVATLLGVNGASLSAIPWNAAWDAEVQSECNDALVALALDRFAAMVVIDGAVYQFTANALEFAPSGGLTAQQTRDAMKLAPTAGTPTADSVDAHLDTIITATGALSGSGAWTVAITVTDDATPAVAVASAVVRLTAGALTYTATSSALGVATFSLDDDTYTLGITKAGYSYTSATVTVNGANVAATKVMTTISIPAAPTASQLTAYGTCRTADGTAENAVVVTFTLQAPSTEGQHSRTALTATSGVTGAYTVTLLRSATYTMSRASGASKARTIVTPAAATYQLPPI
jgi:hypothetical protein